jgi:hypothetical protein
MVWCIFATREWLSSPCRSLEYDCVCVPSFVVDMFMEAAASAIKGGQGSCERLSKHIQGAIQRHEAHYLPPSSILLTALKL